MVDLMPLGLLLGSAGWADAVDELISYPALIRCQWLCCVYKNV